MRSAVLLHGLLTVTVAAAQVGASGSDNAQRLFADLDLNGDGQLTSKEVGKERQMLFSRLLRTADADGDAQLSAQELAAGLEPVRAEKAMVEKQGSKLPGGDALIVFLAKMDADRDGQLKADEIPAAYRAVFDRMVQAADGDKNNWLDSRELAQQAPRLSFVAITAARRMGVDVAAELAALPPVERMAMEQIDAYQRPAAMMADPAQAQELFARLDANGDEKLSLEEAPGPFASRIEQLLNRGDRDGDGQLSKTEFEETTRSLAAFAAAKPDRQAVKRTVRQLLARFDRNHDGKLSDREAPRRIVENFDRLDADANRKLDAGELERVAETMARLRGPRRVEVSGFGPPEMVAEQSGAGKSPPGNREPSTSTSSAKRAKKADRK